MDIDRIIETIVNWLPRLRWYPWSNSEGLKLIDYYFINNTYFLKIKRGDNRFYLPISITEYRPQNIPSDRVIVFDDKYIVEAEFTRNYLNSLSRSEIIRTKYYITSIPLGKESINVKPLTLETSNVLTIHEILGGYKVVVKSYRKLPKIGLEPLIIDLLANNQFKYIPSIIAIYSWDKDTITMAMEYISGEGDGGKPFYDAFIEYLNGIPTYRIGLASLLGVEIALFHKIISSSKHELLKPEDIVEADIRYWINRVERLCKSIMEAMDRLVGEHKWIDYWRIVVDKMIGKAVEDYVEAIQKYIGLKKIRTHQDLHLGQFIYSPSKGFIFTDFEGEPARSEDERLLKEPCPRDLATLLRSYQYLTFTTYALHTSKDYDLVGRTFMEKGDPFIRWRSVHGKAIIYSYLGELANMIPKVIGLGKSSIYEFIELLRPWIIEKALYEIYYESIYRPYMIPIPVTGLKYYVDELRSLA